jgi:uncharacterized protein YaeQ
MALKSTIFKAELSISDMDRQYYASHSFVLARHPSETDERMMVRVLAFAMHAAERLEITRGLSTPDEPDLWMKSLSGEIELWIDLGLPDERRMRKACNRATRVVVLSYGGRAADLWREQIGERWNRFDNLSVVNIKPETTQDLASLVMRSMQLQCSIDGGHVWLSSDDANVEVVPDIWKR